MELRATVYSNRDYLGELSVIDHGRTIQTFEISAKSDPELGVADPPAGRYRLLKIKDTSGEHDEVVSAYGNSVLYFERVGGHPIKSNLKGKFLLAVYGGGDDGDLLPTDGGIRLSDSDLNTLASLVSEGIDLTITEERLGLMSRFTHRKVRKGRVRRLRRSYYGDMDYDDYDDGDDFLFWLMMYEMWEDNGFDDGPYDSDEGPVDYNEQSDTPPVEDTAPVSEPDTPPVEDTVDYKFEPTQASWADPPKDPDPVITDPFASDVSDIKPESWEPPPSHDEPLPPTDFGASADAISESDVSSTYEAANGTSY